MQSTAASKALDDQTGLINSAPSIMDQGVNTIEGSLIDGDDPSSRYGVQKDFAPSSVRGMNALERDIAREAMKYISSRI